MAAVMDKAFLDGLSWQDLKAVAKVSRPPWGAVVVVKPDPNTDTDADGLPCRKTTSART